MDIKKIKDIIDGKFENWEIYHEHERTKKFESNERQICGIEFKEEEGVAFRVLHDNKMFFTYTYDYDPNNVRETILRGAEELLPFLEEDADRGFPLKSKTYPELSLFDAEGLRTSDEIKTELILALESEIRNYDSRIVAVRNCELQEVETSAEILNSNAMHCKCSKTLFTISAYCVAKAGKDEVAWFDWLWANNLRVIDARTFGRKIAEKTISLLHGKTINTGVYEGVLTPQAVCDLLGILTGSFLAENCYKEKTRLKDKVDSQCFSDKLRIMDSGLVGMDAFSFDGEGVPSSETIVVEDGYFKGFLYDTYYGTKYRVESTGNSIRSGVAEPPRCGTRGTYIAGGTRDVADEITNGIIIEELMGTHTANPITGDFSLGAAGFICKNGERNPFQGVIFSGNVFDVLNSVKEVGNDLKFYGASGAPSLYVEGIKISGA